MKKTNWLPLWYQTKGVYTGKIIKKDEIPPRTRLVLKFNKFYKNDKCPKFVYCFSDREALDGIEHEKVELQQHYHGGDYVPLVTVLKLIEETFRHADDDDWRDYMSQFIESLLNNSAKAVEVNDDGEQTSIDDNAYAWAAEARRATR